LLLRSPETVDLYSYDRENMSTASDPHRQAIVKKIQRTTAIESVLPATGGEAQVDPLATVFKMRLRFKMSLRLK
jgi:hypothetical protein